MRSRKAGLTFATRARKRELCLQRYLSRMTRKFLSPTFLNISLKQLFSTFHATLITMSRKYFFGFPRNIFFGLKISKSKIFKLFLETSFVHVSCCPNHYEPKIFFRFSKSGLEGSPLKCPSMTQKTRPLSHRIQKRTGHRRTLADKH